MSHPLAVAACLFAGAVFSHVQEKPVPKRTEPTIEKQKQALAEFNGLVGKWRGIGQPKRGSNRGAWREVVEWAWHFPDKKHAELRCLVKDGKLCKSIRLAWDGKLKQVVMTVAPPKGKAKTLAGKKIGKDYVFETLGPRKGDTIERVKLTLLSNKRTLLLFETGKKTFARKAGIGYTRSGTSIARGGSGQPECVVTGGTGTIRVVYKGKTWFVCCTGCRQAFQDDPEGVLADYRERLRKRQATKRSSDNVNK